MPEIGACHDFLGVSENLAVFVSSGPAPDEVTARAVYSWTYDDAGSGWGHRHALLWDLLDDNGGDLGVEGLMGMGVAIGGPDQGPFSSPWPTAAIIVFNVFDPCVSWDYGTVTVGEAPADVSGLFTYPNPAPIGASTVRFDMAGAGSIAVDVFDVSGRVLRRLARSPRAAGSHVIAWDGRDDHGRSVPAGTYFYRINTGNSVSTRKVVLVR